YTADSSLRGDLKAGNITTEPTYASPGTWELGDMEDGEVVTLTLKAKTAISVDPGLYKDLTWTQGSDSNENEILAQAETEGYVDENFSGTEVGVKEKPQPDEAKTEVKVNKKEIIEEVLGASTERGEVLGLPATGTITAILATLLVSLASGIILIVFGLLRKNKKMSLTRTARVTLISLLVLLAAGAMNFNKVDAAAALRVEDPISPANSEFSITFVLLDTESRPNTNVECYVKKPTSADYIKYQEVSLADGGNTDSCLVNNSVLTEDGTYYFNVKAVFSDETSITSESVSVKYDSKGPGKPRYIKKDKKNSCEYEVKFKTSSEGDTNYVEVYRSFNKEFTVNDSSKIKTISIGNDATYEFTDNLPSDKCGKKPYYAVRAFDEAGNPSNVRVEEITEETIIEKTVNSDSDSEVTTTEGQFIGAAGGLQSLTGTAGEQDQNQTGADQDQGDGAVLGTNEDEGNGNIRTDRERNSSTLLAKLVNALTSPVIYIPVIILAVLGLYLGAKKRLKNSQK
ncbi:MAG TPA: hypothetical protein PLF29_03220, partial [bacterium]|nr:hypothetical protein [bacterium]